MWLLKISAEALQATGDPWGSDSGMINNQKAQLGQTDSEAKNRGHEDWIHEDQIASLYPDFSPSLTVARAQVIQQNFIALLTLSLDSFTCNRNSVSCKLKAVAGEIDISNLH